MRSATRRSRPASAWSSCRSSRVCVSACARRRIRERGSKEEAMLALGPLVTVALFAGLFLLSGIKILREYERAVIFRLGRLVSHRGPGLVYVIPGIEKMLKVDLRTITMDIPSQDVITKDNVSVKVNAVL